MKNKIYSKECCDYHKDVLLIYSVLKSVLRTMSAEKLCDTRLEINVDLYMADDSSLIKFTIDREK